MNSRKLLLIVFLAVTGMSLAMEFAGPEVKSRMALPPPDSYDRQWQKIDSLENKGLPKSALEIVNKIYVEAKAEKNAAQFIKAIIHRMKFEQYVEEYSLEKSLNKLNEEVKEAEYPVTPILHSMIAENYWQYYQNNRWRFHERTATVNFKNDDITTWDLKTIFGEVVRHYNLSLKNPGQLKQTTLNIYAAIVISGSDSRKFRPTLYDFLAHRAVDFYMNDEPGILQPAYKFELNQENYFSPAEGFSGIKVVSKDTLSSKLYATRILQDLIAFHLNDVSPEALIDVDLKRLKFVRNHSVIEIKDSLYLSALQSLENKFPTHPASAEVSCEIARVYFEKGSKYNPQQSEENKWSKKKALEICESTIKKFPGSFGALNCEVLKAQVLEKSIDFTTEKITSSDRPFLALINYKNLKTAHVRIAQMNIDEYHKSQDRYYGEQLIKQYLKLAPLKKWTVELPDDGDYQQHSVEISIPALPYGHYVILIGSDKNLSYKKNEVAYASFWVSDISYVNRNNTNGSADFYLFHRESGQPLKNVEAQLYYTRYDYKSRKYINEKAEKYTSDENGYFQIKAVGSYRSFNIELTRKTTTATDKLYTGASLYQDREYNYSRKRTSTFFFLDRAIYRPGQTIYFKGIVIDGDGENNEVLVNHKSTVTLYDVNQQRVTSLDFTTNEYGTFTGSFTAPVDLLNGQMTIRDEYGSVSFSVEEYKRPKFYVEFNPIKGSYRLNETIKISGAAKAYSGANIDGAEVKYRVVRNASFPGWWYWWRGYYPQSASMEIISGVTTSNDSGGFFIDFKAIPDMSLSKSYQPTYTYTVYADVTDINGETRSSQTGVNVAYTAMKLNVAIPEMLENEAAKSFAITTMNLNGQFEPAEGKIAIYKLKEPGKTYRTRNWQKPDKHVISKEEFEKLFPKDEYENENNRFSWERGEKIIEKQFANKSNAVDSLRIANLGTLKPGTYVMEANTKDIYGEPVKDVKYFTIYSNKGQQVPGNYIDWFNLITDGPVEPGEKAKFVIGTKEQDVRVVYEIEHKGKIIKKEFIHLSDEQKMIEIPIEESYRGNFSLHCVFVKDNRSYVHDELIHVPFSNKELDIEFETFRDKLNPGQQEEWKVKIKDKNGQHLAAEMLATLYDASLDAFKKNNWYFNIFNYSYSQSLWSKDLSFGAVNAQTFGIDWNIYPSGAYRDYERLNWFGYNIYDGYGYAYAEVAVSKSGRGEAQKCTCNEISWQSFQYSV